MLCRELLRVLSKNILAKIYKYVWFQNIEKVNQIYKQIFRLTPLGLGVFPLNENSFECEHNQAFNYRNFDHIIFFTQRNETRKRINFVIYHHKINIRDQHLETTRILILT